MLHEHDRDTPVGNLPDQVIDLLGLDRIAPGRRLIKEQNARLCRKSSGDFETLAGAIRERPCRRVRSIL